MFTRVLAALLVCSSFTVTSAFADDIIDGQVGPGALYRLVRPTVWNGRLVVYAHGTVLPTDPVALPAEANLIVSLLVPQGFAVAFSSFSENGWAVKDGAQRTHQLLGIFASKFGSPTRTYVAGASLGGLIAIDLVEKYPREFAGALPACAPAGGSRLQFDYAANVRALFDLFYPNAHLPGDAGNVDTTVDIPQAIVAPAVAAMTADPSGALTIASITQTPVPFASIPELFQSMVTALANHALAFRDILDRTHGHAYFDNRRTIYTGLLPAPLLQAINFGIERFDAKPDALAYLEHYSHPDGDIRVPMLMLSNARDPEVPGLHPSAYAAAVAGKGSASLLVQRSINRYGHCNFTPTELGQAFTDLVLWSEFGVKP